MKLSLLLAQRQRLLRQARLANLAFAHQGMKEFVRRIARGAIRGEVRLQQAEPAAERYWASLTALEGNQSVIEEHFTDQDAMDLADVIAYATGNEVREHTFRLEEFAEHFLAPLDARLEQAGVAIDDDDPTIASAQTNDASDYSHADEDD